MGFSKPLKPPSGMKIRTALRGRKVTRTFEKRTLGPERLNIFFFFQGNVGPIGKAGIQGAAGAKVQLI